MRSLCLSALALLVAVTAPAASSRRRSVNPTVFPPCTMIIGSPAVTFTRDEGRTLATPVEKLSGVGYTFGVAALDATTLLSWHKTTLSISTDSGCSWRPLEDMTVDIPPSITASQGRAFAWSDNRPFLVRYDARGMVALKPPGSIGGLAIDPANPDHVRLGSTQDGFIWDSRDAGVSWEAIGRLPGSLLLIYRYAFDPADLNHIMAGIAGGGAQVSRDGGATWTASAMQKARANIFSVAFSPADTSYVWAEGLDLDAAPTDPSDGRHIYLSTDGGVSFKAVVTQGAGITLINGTLLAPHPTKRDVLYFVFGSYFQGYGTDLYRYDDSTHVVTLTHNDYNDIDAIAFSPADPNVMYLGLEVVSGVQ
jgi:hypothetical protein